MDSAAGRPSVASILANLITGVEEDGDGRIRRGFAVAGPSGDAGDGSSWSHFTGSGGSSSSMLSRRPDIATE